MPKETLKSITERYKALQKATHEYVQKVRSPRTRTHSSTPASITKPEGGKGLQVVTIADLISTTKAAELLGYQTVLQVQNGGTQLAVLFVEDTKTLAIPSELYWEVQ